MQREMFQEIPENKRASYLKDNCDRLEPVTYMKTFDDIEIVGFKDELSEKSIEIDGLEERKKEENKLINEQLKPLKSERAKLLRNIRTKAEEVREDCFMFIDQDSRMVGFYNAKGQLVSSRPIRPQEMQTTIFSVERTGTND